MYQFLIGVYFISNLRTFENLLLMKCLAFWFYFIIFGIKMHVFEYTYVYFIM